MLFKICLILFSIIQTMPLTFAVDGCMWCWCLRTLLYAKLNIIYYGIMHIRTSVWGNDNILSTARVQHVQLQDENDLL